MPGRGRKEGGDGDTLKPCYGHSMYIMGSEHEGTRGGAGARVFFATTET